MDRREMRLEMLLKRTSSLKVAVELLEYNKPLPQRVGDVRLPLAAEPHVDAWKQYATEAQSDGVFEVLQKKLVQLRFPISAGISLSPAYRAVTRHGAAPDTFPEATALHLERPEDLQLRLCPTLAGTLPTLTTGCRHDFVALVQALAHKNEPEPIPDSMGSSLISGYSNWDRINELRRRWDVSGSGLSWTEEFRERIIPHKQLYQDRFLILCNDPYSQVPAQALGLADDQWREMSATIRVEHEALHYLVFRLYSQLRTNVLDELWADYRGIIAVLGHYRAEWGLRFVGLHDYPTYHPGSRLENYRKLLSDEAFTVLQTLVTDAAHNLEQIERHYTHQLTSTENDDRLLLALISQTLEELASQDALSFFQQALASV